MQNGYDIFLMGDDEPGVEDTSYADDGLGTWAANYKYENGVFETAVFGCRSKASRSEICK